jgi:hypothetical protein
MSIDKKSSIISNYQYKSTKFEKLQYPKTTNHHGAIAAWIQCHPNFTAAELIKSGVCKAPSNAIEYYEEFIAYREFFQLLNNS